jgi:FAD/FMN-containing dehydrogenase
MSDFVEKLRAIVGDKGLIVDEQGKHSYVTDWRESFVGNALAVVRPANTQEVADVVRLCAAEKVSVVPQGGNTGLVGGGIPQEKGREIVLSLNRMTRITDIDPIGYTMTVEAGVILKTIQETAAANDRLFPLSLGSPKAAAQIGGNLSTNAGGVASPGITAIRPPARASGSRSLLPTGEIWNGLRALKKDNTGYDLRDLYHRRRRHAGHHHPRRTEAVAQAQGRRDGLGRGPLARGRRRPAERRTCRL